MTNEETPFTRRAQQLYDRVKGWGSRWYAISDGEEHPQWAGWLFSSLSVASLGDEIEYVYVHEEKLDGPAHSFGRIVVLTTTRVLSIDLDTDGIAHRIEFPVMVRPRTAIRSVEVTAKQTWFSSRSFNGRPNGHPVSVILRFNDAAINLEFVAGTVVSHLEAEDSLERVLSSLQ